MSGEIAVSGPAEVQPNAPEASSDDQLLTLWLHGRSHHTQRAYLADVDRFRSRAGKTLACVTLADLQDFAASFEDLAPATRYRALSAVKSLLAFGHRIGYLQFDVGRVLRLPSFRNRLSERILPEADVHRMLSLEPDNRNRALLTLLYASGIRVSELCALCWRDLQPNGDGGQITVLGKGSVTRSVQLPAAVWKQLQLLRGSAGPEDPVFRSRKKGGGLQTVAVLRLVKRAAERAGIDGPVSPHWLRHAHASHAARPRCPHPPGSGHPRSCQHHNHGTLPSRPARRRARADSSRYRLSEAWLVRCNSKPRIADVRRCTDRRRRFCWLDRDDKPSPVERR